MRGNTFRWVRGYIRGRSPHPFFVLKVRAALSRKGRGRSYSRSRSWLSRLLKYLREPRLELARVGFDVVVVDRIDRDLVEPRQPFRRRHISAGRRAAVFA